MKLLRHGPKGHEKPAMLDAQGQVRDLSALIPDLRAEMLTPEGLAVLRAIDKTEVLPRDVDGRVPSSMTIDFRPYD